jgi:hypothetical protein
VRPAWRGLPKTRNKTPYSAQHLEPCVSRALFLWAKNACGPNGPAFRRAVLATRPSTRQGREKQAGSDGAFSSGSVSQRGGYAARLRKKRFWCAWRSLLKVNLCEARPVLFP